MKTLYFCSLSVLLIRHVKLLYWIHVFGKNESIEIYVITSPQVRINGNQVQLNFIRVDNQNC